MDADDRCGREGGGWSIKVPFARWWWTVSVATCLQWWMSEVPIIIIVWFYLHKKTARDEG